MSKLELSIFLWWPLRFPEYEPVDHDKDGEPNGKYESDFGRNVGGSVHKKGVIAPKSLFWPEI